jgi:hypothetical protein
MDGTGARYRTTGSGEERVKIPEWAFGSAQRAFGVDRPGGLSYIYLDILHITAYI